MIRNKLQNIWKSLYGDSGGELLDQFIEELSQVKSSFVYQAHPDGWYKDAVVYSTYVDLYNKDFNGLKEKLPYLQDLGVNCLWLLPILDSPMRDAGFDIRDYRMIRPDLTGNPEHSGVEGPMKVFEEFLAAARSLEIHVIFDIAMNHTSDQHEWFKQSGSHVNNPYRDYYIWNKDTNLYKETRLLFKGMCPSNWEKDGDHYYFHRFFEFQPDLNYRNPKVLIEMCRNLIFWQEKGVDGFRADAIPYIWKEDGTNCENLPGTHQVVKFFRAVVDFIRPNTLLLAEACQPPLEVVKYFGENDECHAGYHFPLMPQIFKALAVERAEPVLDVLHPSITPAIDNANQWFLFLRLHDELTLEMVTPEDRKIIYDYYCRDPKWDFRVGEGISARLANLMSFDDRRICLAFSVMLTLPGTPVIYYGDEFARGNDEKFYEEMIQLTGKNDTRFFVRGRMDWSQIKKDLEYPDSLTSKVHRKLKRMLSVRNKFKAFGRGTMEWITVLKPQGYTAKEILAYQRTFGNENVLVIHNLSSSAVKIVFPLSAAEKKLISLLSEKTNTETEHDIMELAAFETVWFQVM